MPQETLPRRAASNRLAQFMDHAEERRAYQPQDGHIAINAPDNEETEQMAGAARDVIERLNWLSGKW
jgi:hypothetical protein